jgi:hypothetical protein
MPYGTLKADTLTYYTATGDVNLAISGIALQGAALVSGVSGIFTTVVSGATVTGNAGQFTTITGGTANFANITGVSGTFTTRISGATVTGNTAQFTTATAVTGVFTTSVSGATVTGDLGLFNTLSGNQVVLATGLSIPSGSASSPSISVNGDPNTGLYSPGADQVAISTNGTGRLFVDASGNVGVGSTPGAWTSNKAIQIQSAALSNFSNTLTNNQTFLTNNAYFNNGVWKYVYSDIAAMYEQRHQGGHAWYNASSGTAGNAITFNEAMRLDSSGRLGLGTSSPSNDLDVLKTASGSTTTARIGATATTGANNATLILNNGGTGNSTLRFDYESSANRASIGVLASDQKLTFSTAGTTAMTIDASQRLGIGTTSPGAPLEVIGTAGTISARASTSVSSLAIQIYNNGTDSFIDSTAYGAGSGGAIVFRRNGTTELGRWDTSGRLLVGTSSSVSIGGGTAINQIFSNSNGEFVSLHLGFNASAGASPVLALSRSRNTSYGSYTVVQSGDSLGRIRFTGDDGSDYDSIAALIEAQVDGTPGTNDMPGRLVFSTTADGASSPTERVRISQNGVVTVKNGAVAEIGTLTDGATVTPDFAANCNFTLTISGNRTLANPTNITAGQTGSIFIIQGSGSNTLSWGSYWDFAGGTAPTLSTASGAIDRVDYVVRTSTSIHTVFTANYS